MNKTILSILLLLSISFAEINGQSFFERRYYSFSAGAGFCIIQYYNDFTPVYFGGGPTNEGLKYSPSWYFEFKSTWWLNKNFDFSFGLSHTTITEKNKTAIVPDWDVFSNKRLIQGFFHVTPSINIKLPDDRFKINLGFKIGTINPIGTDFARESSHTWGSVHADICLESGFSLMINKKIYFESKWVEGLTWYDYSISMPVESVSFFKYRAFLFGLNYLFHGKK